MKKLLFIFMAASLSVVASAQKVYFLYLQTDDQSPFYVRLSDKIYSSAVSGFLILPNLTDSTYNINIGFAKSTKPEIKFAVTINQNDRGYLIKNFDDGLSLFDIQNVEIIKPTKFNKDNTVFETKSDKFSSTLSKAADDPGLLKVAVVKKEEPKEKVEQKELIAKSDEPKPILDKPKDTITSNAKSNLESTEVKTEKKETMKADTVASIQNNKPVQEVKQTVIKEEPINILTQADYKPTLVIRHSESSTTEGLGIVYFDKGLDKTDTIRILIPPSKLKFFTAPEQTTAIDTQSKTTMAANESIQFFSDSALIKKESVEIKPVKTSSCDAVASDKDFMKVRKNMAAKSNDEDMIAEARKSFKSKCFTSEQVRYLSTLFLTSAAKYQFFDTAYTHVSDKQNFSSLQSEIKDEYYLKRFKALVGE